MLPQKAVDSKKLSRFCINSNSIFELKACKCTWKKRVLNTQHGGPVAITHGLHDVLFSHVSTTILYPDACLQVVEMSSIQLKELDEQNAKVHVGIPGINSWV